MQHDDVVHGHAELIANDLRKGRLFTLAVRRSSCENGDFPAWLDLHGRALPAAGGSCGRRPEGADLAICRDADAHQTTVRARLGLLTSKIVVSDGLQSLTQRRLIVAAVIH